MPITSLFENGPNFIPKILSNEQFLSLFADETLDISDDLLQKFLDQVADWPKLKQGVQDHQTQVLKLEQDILQFKKGHPQLPLKGEKLQQEREALCQRQQTLNQEFSALRSTIEKIYHNKRIWNKFTPIWNNTQQLPFEHADQLLTLIQDQSLMDEIESHYRSMITRGTPQTQTLASRMENISNQLLTCKEEPENEAVSAYLFLAANKGFIIKDFEDLQVCLRSMLWIS